MFGFNEFYCYRIRMKLTSNYFPCKLLVNLYENNSLSTNASLTFMIRTCVPLITGYLIRMKAVSNSFPCKLVNLYENSSLGASASLTFMIKTCVPLTTGNTCRGRSLRFNSEFDQRRGSWPRLPSSSPCSSRMVLGGLNFILLYKSVHSV